MTTIEQQPHYLAVNSSRANTKLMSTLFLSTPRHTGAEKGDSK